ncbi:hypothetical protein [Metasolibacillus sp.]|uniref:hypothetical protein n=1 Tax=Metasolibacillus sp. TaxID=2703680 RepID=UPI0025DA3EEF|nr:hypothetical protein [Metasolibacillus sp.]MCT6925315.1 hypothetical protein [Metasolibacillus sp.]MCT6941455.1 hypothetical protein [Metasolibacillus sp.]
MVIKINTRKATIPVEIDGDLKFEIDMSDESLQQNRTVFEKFHAAAHELEDEDFDGAKELIINALDELLGTGAGNAIYERVGGAFACVDVFNQLAEGIAAEASKRGLQMEHDKVTQYVQSKKQH